MTNKTEVEKKFEDWWSAWNLGGYFNDDTRFAARVAFLASYRMSESPKIDKLVLIQEWWDKVSKLDNWVNKWLGLGVDVDTFSTVFGMQDKYTQYVGEKLNDQGNWLSWWLYETTPDDKGNRSSVVRFSGDTEDFIVDSLEKLLYVIERDV